MRQSEGVSKHRHPSSEKAIGAERNTLNGRRNGMKCPKCRNGFPKGGRFCPNCGFEPMGKLTRNLALAMMLVNFPVAMIILLRGVPGESWFDIITGGLSLTGVAGSGVYLYLWYRWTRPADLHYVGACDTELS